MKAYLIITGTIFGLIAALHVWRAIVERHAMTTDPAQFISMIALGVLSAVLSVWAWCLVGRKGRP